MTPPPAILSTIDVTDRYEPLDRKRSAAAADGLERAEPAGVGCQHLVKRFPDGTTALDDATLDCPAGRITVLLGPSGCGKTTLLRCIAGLESPTSGTLTIGGLEVTTVDAGLRGVAMVFQNHALYPDKTVARNLEFPLRMARVPRAERLRRVADTAALMRLDGLLQRRPSELSGGQRQRVGIGRALIREPQVLLMDEPFSSLDAELRVEMRAEFLTLQRRLGMTTVYVTHDQVEALSLADRLAVLRGGRVEQVAAAEEMFRRPATTFVASFLGGMNLLAGTADAGQLRLDAVAPPIGLAVDKAAGTALTLGVRPEDLLPGPGRRGDATFDLAVVLSELLGRERLVHGRIGGQTVKVRQHADLPVADHMTVHARPDDLHLFDATGRRLPTPSTHPDRSE